MSGRGWFRKRWRYVGVFSPTVSICAAHVRVGPGVQEFWAVWDRTNGELHEHTRRVPGRVRLPDGQVDVTDGVDMDLDLELDPTSTIEVTTPVDGGTTWTSKTVGHASGLVTVERRRLKVSGTALVDDSRGRHPRHTEWRWSAGAGLTADGRTVAWNLVAGINDTSGNSENTVWVNGAPTGTGVAIFAEDLSTVTVGTASLAFTAEAERSRVDRMGPVRSSYRQPFGTFTGTLPGGVELTEGYGVMEHHTARW